MVTEKDYADIRKEFRLAKDKKMQITILADIYCTSRKQIALIVKDEEMPEFLANKIGKSITSKPIKHRCGKVTEMSGNRLSHSEDLRNCANSIGKAINNFLESNNLLPAQMADDLGIKRSSLCYYLSGNSTPDAATLIKLANYMSISIDELVGRNAVCL